MNHGNTDNFWKTVVIVSLLVSSGCANLLQPSPTVSLLPEPTALTPNKTPPPFPYAYELPEKEFLFIHVDDYDNTCVDGFCQCVVLEWIAKEFEFIDGKLRLHLYPVEPPSTSWVSLRENHNLSALYSDWSPGNVHLQIFSSFPILTPAGNFSILGVNSNGDIQVMIADEYVVIPFGKNYKYAAKQPELIDDNCKVLHNYIFYNYGFIKDDNVEFEQP